MRITQWGEYGIHITFYLAWQREEGQKIIGAADIAKALKLDIQYAQQILQKLRKGQIVESIRGAQGGYSLSRDASSITLHDVLLAAEGETFEIICDSKPLNSDCSAPFNTCSLKPIWRDLKEHVDGFFKKYTIATLVEFSKDKANTPAFIENLVQIKQGKVG